MYRLTPLKYFSIKPIIDVFFALVLFALLLPFFIIIAFTIFLEDRDFPFFSQIRIGKNGRPFVIYKFRTMKKGTPNLSTADLQASKINSITKIGLFLRKSSVDEAPQLFNIIKGEMSFIGPRPALVSQKMIINNRAKNGVDALLPGITGLAQVRGRDDLSDLEKINWDIEYLKKASFFFDCQILLETTLIVFLARGNK